MFKTNIENFITETLVNTNDNCKVNAKLLNSFFIAMAKNGFNIYSVFNGEEKEIVQNGNRFQALDIIFGVDESVVLFTKDDTTVSCNIILDCTGIESISDYGIKASAEKYESIDLLLAKIMDDLDK